jgi:hypothetical protein
VALRTTLDDDEEGAGDEGATPDNLEAEASCKVAKEEDTPSENGNEDDGEKGSRGWKRLDDLDVVDKLDPISAVIEAVALDGRLNGKDSKELLAGKPDENEDSPDERKEELEVVVEEEITEVGNVDDIDDDTANGMARVDNNGEEDRVAPEALVKIGMLGEFFSEFPTEIFGPDTTPIDVATAVD